MLLSSLAANGAHDLLRGLRLRTTTAAKRLLLRYSPLLLPLELLHNTTVYGDGDGDGDDRSTSRRKQRASRGGCESL